MGDVVFAIKDRASDFDKLSSQILFDLVQRIPSIDVDVKDGTFQVVLADDATGDYRRLFLNRAEQLASPSAQWLPVLLVGDDGAGTDAWLHHLRHLLDADLVPIDLSRGAVMAQQVMSQIRTFLTPQPEGSRARIVYWKCLDRIKLSGPAQQQVFEKLFEAIQAQTQSSDRFPDTLHVVQIGWTKRLSLATKELRKFIDDIESLICEGSGFARESCPMNSLGYVEGPPRVVVFPSLKDCGRGYIRRLLDTRLAAGDNAIRLGDDLTDALVRDVDWDGQGGIAGLYATVDSAISRCRASGRDMATLEDAPQELSSVIGAARPVRLTLESLSYSYSTAAGPVEAVRDFSFSVREGDIVMVVGPSGCGKTTVLRLIAGLLRPSSGRSLVDGLEVVRPQGKVGLVFQSYTSYPWLSVYKNVEFGLSIQRPFDRVKAKATVEALLKAVGLEAFKNVYVSSLSGGMRQRVAIARALAVEPEVVLMDEPFGALDAQTRWTMQELLLEIRNRFQMTVVFVTHDIEEAVFLGSRVVVCAARPLRPIRTFRIPFRWEERTPELKGRPDFVNLREQIRQILEKESRNLEPVAKGI